PCARRGCVVDGAGAGIASVAIVCMDRRGVELARATMDADGSFAMSVARAPGTLLQLATDPASGFDGGVEATLDPRQPGQLVVKTVGALRGQLRDASGRALAFADVTLAGIDAQRRHERFVVGALADREGVCEFAAVEPGPCRLQVRGRDGSLRVGELEVQAGE